MTKSDNMAIVRTGFTILCVTLVSLNSVKCESDTKVFDFASVAEDDWIMCPTSNFTDVPEHCECRNSTLDTELTIVCRESANLHHIPHRMSIDLTHLKIQDQFFLEEILPHEFDSYPNLETLMINSCDLRLIQGDAFSNLTHLITLDLTRNMLGSSSFTNTTFRGLESLKTLKLDENDLYKVDARVISGIFMPHVSFISMRMCKLEDIADYAFDMLGQMSKLDLSFNQLTKIPKIGGCVKHAVLEFTNFNLSHNQIEHLEGFHCEEMNVLEVIDLSYNQIAFLADGSLKYGDDNLRELYVQHNKIRLIQLDAFQRSKKTLKILDVSHNSLITLPNSALEANRMRKILVAGNEWHCDCELSWFNKVHAVKDYNSNTSLICDSPSTVQNQSIRGNPVFQHCMHHASMGKAIGIVIAVLISIAVVLGLAYFLFRYVKGRKQEPRDPAEARSHPIGNYKRMQNSTLFAFDYDDRDRDITVQGANSNKQPAPQRGDQATNNNRQQQQSQRQQQKPNQQTAKPREREMDTWKTSSDTAELTSRDDPGIGPFTIE